MHSHPYNVEVYLSNSKGNLILPDGTVKAFSVTPGEVHQYDPTVHRGEVMPDGTLEAIEIGFK
jgi:hypothetical protein